MAFLEGHERLETMDTGGKEGAGFEQSALDRFDQIMGDDKLMAEGSEATENFESRLGDEAFHDQTLMDKYDKILGDDKLETVDQERDYYDDKGRLYRTGNELTPNNEYEINGYRYKTGENGCILSAEGTLHLKDREGRLPIRDSLEDIGKGDEREGDDRGHLIGDQFDGSNGLENMIPQDAAVNRNAFKNFENELARNVKDGKTVEYRLEPIYEDDSRRPTAIVVTYSIEGEENIRIFPNGEER